MVVKTLKLYKTPLILSLTLSIVLIALRVEREVLSIIAIFGGSLLGTFILDLDYIIQAFFIEPDRYYSNLVKDYLKHYDIGGLLAYINHSKEEFEQRALNNALFQIILGALTIFVITSTLNPFLKALALSTFLNSIYRFFEEFLNNRADEWFWSLNIKTKSINIYLYLVIMIISLIYTIYLF